MVSDQSIDYEKLARESLRSVIRASLEQAIDGLPGNHHFFITIQTGAPGVEISEGLRAAYPEEITIVIQHQYLDLFVEPDRFSVTLFFANTPERLTVPYKAVSRFYDPSVPFGLIFDVDLDTKLQSTADLEAVPALVEELIEDIAEAMGRSVNSIRGKALSLLRAGQINAIPKQEVTKGSSKADPLADLDISEMSVEDIADEIGKTPRGVKTMLTRRGLQCADYNGAARKEIG